MRTRTFVFCLMGIFLSAGSLCPLSPTEAASPDTHQQTNGSSEQPDGPIYPVHQYRERTVRGWKLKVHQKLEIELPEKTAEAVRLLDEQLAFIEQHVPPKAVDQLRQVPLWFSPRYPDAPPKAEYHVSPAWLRAHRRPVEMAKSIEFTNIPIFEKEVERMPVWVLHELAHAYHDRVLGWNHAAILACYEEAMRQKLYDRVMRSNGRLVRAYAATNAHEYFAELTEAFFGVNDFFPFDRRQLCRFDPKMWNVLIDVWGVDPETGGHPDSGPLRLHPENPHYFLWRGEPTVLVTSGEHYGALLNLDFDYRRYFAELARHGLNHTRIFSGTYRERPDSFRITDNPLAPKPGRYLAPWKRSDQPGYAIGGNRFDLMRFDPAYFDRLRSVLTEADRLGITVELTLFCPLYRENLWKASPMHISNNVNGIGDCPRNEVLSLKHPKLLAVQLAVTRKIVQAAQPFDNVYFEVCNEPYITGVSDAWQRRIVREILETEKDLPKKHLISFNIANGRKKIVDPPKEVSIFNFHYCVPPDTVAMNYGLNRVIGENETGFRGKADILYRTEGWDFVLAGGALYNNLDYSFTPQHPDGSFREFRSPGGGSERLRRQLGILKRFIESFDFIAMRPDAEVIENVQPRLTHYALSERGRQYAIYFHVPIPLKPKKLKQHLRSNLEAHVTVRLPAGHYRLEWIDPLTGRIIRRVELKHKGGSADLTSPRFDNDVALRIQATKSQ